MCIIADYSGKAVILQANFKKQGRNDDCKRDSRLVQEVL